MKRLTVDGYKFEAVFTNGKTAMVEARTYHVAMDYFQDLAGELGTRVHSVMNVF